MSVREFAAHLGVNDAAVSNWERRGDLARLRYHTQEILDTDLAMAPAAVRERFDVLLTQAHGAAASLSDDGPGGARAGGTTASDVGRLGQRSAARTRDLLQTLQPRLAETLTYLAPCGVLERWEEFLSSAARVFVVKGPSGSGKTRMTYHAADALAHVADIQLLTAASWDVAAVDLATEILRYASVPAGDDALLTLERASELLTRPCLVLIDGIGSQDDFDRIGRQVDAVLRQVGKDRLRFVLLARTPPEIEVTGYPVLSASIFDGKDEVAGTSWLLGTWGAADARRTWNSSRAEGSPEFDDLPPSIRQLVRLPQYMHLVRAADPGGPSGDVNAFALIRRCVDAIVGQVREIDTATTTLTDLAAHQLSHLVPEGIDGTADDALPDRGDLTDVVTNLPQLVRWSGTGRPEFTHDILREFFFASMIADRLKAVGPSLAAVAAMNDLAAAATTSASARQIFEFVAESLDESAPDLLTAVTLSPTVSLDTTLPLLIDLASKGLGFATSQVWVSAARRCGTNPSLELARALLTGPALRDAMGMGHSRWLLSVLRSLGSAIWPQTATLIEQTMDAHAARHLLETADLDAQAEATFLARHVFLFVAEGQDLPAPVEALLAHPDWRVRAALAEGLRDQRAPRNHIVESMTMTLVHDRDYKVRAATPSAVTGTGTVARKNHVIHLLTDENWYVRERTLEALSRVHDNNAGPTSPLASAATELLLAQESWRRPPAHVAPLLQRLLILSGLPGPDHLQNARHRALFLLLREIRSGWPTLPDAVRRSILQEAQASQDWLVRQEADAALTIPDGDALSGFPADVSLRRTAYRRLRGQRHLQVALDMHDLGEATTVAVAAAEAGADFLEVGDPLIKRVGLAAVEHLKRHVPKTPLVVEMMSADWGRDQVILAAQAGADIVLLIGPASTSSVAAAVEAGRRLGVPIMLDAGQHRVSRQWVRDMERAGIDGLTVTTNIDLGIAGRDPLNSARILRSWTQLPVAITGGFSPSDHALIASPDWDVLIVGRSIADAVDPASAARTIVELVRNDHRTAR
jgi:3-keto-L-gulonate-6-phosphate decarboxylase/HEAT repeat protein